MTDIVDIDAFKQRKLAKATAEWDQYMARAEEFKLEGKNKFADEMISKAKAVRIVIDKLRGPVKPDPAPYLKFGNHDAMLGITVTINGLAGVDYGYPKTPERPPTST